MVNGTLKVLRKVQTKAVKVWPKVKVTVKISIIVKDMIIVKVKNWA